MQTRGAVESAMTRYFFGTPRAYCSDGFDFVAYLNTRMTVLRTDGRTTQESIRNATRELAKAIAVEPRTLKEAGLVYVSDEEPGLRRRKSGKHFVFFDTDGKRIRDEKVIARIRRLAIPPAYTDVWICSRENGHLQATGRDARGRKQYRYHAGWRMVRDAAKYERLADFADKLPALRRAVNADLEASRIAAPQSARRGRAVAAAFADPRRQRGIFARERFVRIDDAAQPARECARQADLNFRSAAKAENSTPSSSTTSVWRAWCAIVRNCPDRNFSVSTTMKAASRKSIRTT